MPVVEDETGEVLYQPAKPAQATKPGAPGAPPTGPQKPTMPAAPTAPTTGLRGKARFESEVNRRSFVGGHWGEDFNQWVLSLPDDPLDPEYNETLRWARDQARQRLAAATKQRQLEEWRRREGVDLGSAARVPKERGTFIPAPGPPERTTPGLPPNQPDFVKPRGYSSEPGPFEHGRLMTEREDFTFKVPEGALQPGAPTQPFPNQATGPKTQSEQAKEIAQLEAEKEPGKRKLAAIEWGKPVFRGAPFDADEYMTPTVAATMDTDLNKFLSDEGIHLEPTRASAALQSGDYVYMGQEHNATLGVSRDSYLYVGNAMAAGADQRVLPREVIAQYQKDLGLPVSGYLDDTLTKIWEYSVKLAAYYAQSNPDNKVTPRELFDLHVQGEIAKYRSGGGGGGGGAGAEPLVAFDYYRAMMQILGDISGVGEAA